MAVEDPICIFCRNQLWIPVRKPASKDPQLMGHTSWCFISGYRNQYMTIDNWKKAFDANLTEMKDRI